MGGDGKRRIMNSSKARTLRKKERKKKFNLISFFMLRPRLEFFLPLTSPSRFYRGEMKMSYRATTSNVITRRKKKKKEKKSRCECLGAYSALRLNWDLKNEEENFSLSLFFFVCSSHTQPDSAPFSFSISTMSRREGDAEQCWCTWNYDVGAM